MSFRVTRNSDGTIMTESDGPANEIDHVNAQRNRNNLSEYMRDTGLQSIEGRNYHDIIDRIADAEVEKYGGDHAAERSYVGLKLMW